MKPISTGRRARSIGIQSSAKTKRNCPTISTTRNTFQFRTRESSILASLWSWISLVSSYPTTTTKFATSSAEEVLTADKGFAGAAGRPRTGGRFLEQVGGGGFAGVGGGGQELTQRGLEVTP